MDPGSLAVITDQSNSATCVCEALAKAVVEGKYYDVCLMKWPRSFHLTEKKPICLHNKYKLVYLLTYPPTYLPPYLA